MVNLIIFILYFIFSTLGMVFIKFGAKEGGGVLIHIPVVDFNISFLTFFGFGFYALSFFLYAILLGKYELSFLNPATIGISSILIFVSAAIFFGESITAIKMIGLMLILLGVFTLNIFK